MYCRKCGEEIKDSSKFCPYCGCDTNTENSITHENAGVLEQGKAPEDKGAGKWMIPAAVIAGVIVIGAAAVFGVKAFTEPGEKPTDGIAEIQEEQPDETPVEKTSGEAAVRQSRAVSSYPAAVELNGEVEDELSRFLWVLGNVDCKMCGGSDGQGLKSKDRTYITYGFLFMSLYESIPFADGEVVEPQNVDGYTWLVSENIAETYLKNSLNSSDYLYMPEEGLAPVRLENGIVYVAGFDPSSIWTVEEPVINSVTALSENEIELEGTIAYSNIESGSSANSFDIVMTANPDSMWGGYTLQSIYKWESPGKYILPEAAERNYTKEELKSMDAHTLYLARNEIYARHGYIFNNQDLKDYFGGMAWYTPTVTEVPDTEFNEYEKANLALLQSREAQLAEEEQADRLYEEVESNFAYTEQEVEYLEQINQFRTDAKTIPLDIYSVYTDGSEVCVDIELEGESETLFAYKIDDTFVFSTKALENGQKAEGLKYGMSHTGRRNVFEAAYVFRSDDGELSYKTIH